MRENTDQNNSEYGHFLRNDSLHESVHQECVHESVHQNCVHENVHQTCVNERVHQTFEHEVAIVITTTLPCSCQKCPKTKHFYMKFTDAVENYSTVYITIKK